MKDDLISVNKVGEIIEEVYGTLINDGEDVLNRAYWTGVDDFRNMLHSLLTLESDNRAPLRQLTRRCLTCGEEFTISAGELDWLFERDLKPYKRCKVCRKTRKTKKEINTNVN